MNDENDKILQRILRTAGSPELLQILTGRLSPTDLQSLLLEVYRARAAERAPRELLQQYRHNRFVRPSEVVPQQSARFDELAFSLLPQGFEAVELSPVSPLGSCSVLGPVSQKNVIATIRNTEVCADGTNMLALECAARRTERHHQAEQETIKLCASHRVVRAQQFEGPATYPHFRALHLCSASRDRGNFRVQSEAVREHIAYFLRLLEESKRLGLSIAGIRVRIMPFSPEVFDHLQENEIEEIGSGRPAVTLELEHPPIADSGYYHELRFQIYASNDSSREFFLVDGGLTRWMAKLLSNRKESFLISGMGSERFLASFQSPPAA